MDRRQFLIATTVGAASFAGCTSSNTGPQSNGSNQNTTTEEPTLTEKSTATSTAAGHEEDHHQKKRETKAGHHEGGQHGGEHHHGMATIPDSPTPHATVEMLTNNGHHFDPHVVWVEKGSSVTWVLKSGAHSTTAYHPKNDKPLRIPQEASSWNSGILSKKGTTFEHTFETEGVYDYFCIPHEAMGMLGSVIVGQPDAHNQPALEPPQNSLPKTAQKKIKELNKMVNKALGHTH